MVRVTARVRFTVYEDAELMDFINAPVGLSTLLSLVVAIVARADNVLGRGLPITEKLRPLIASKAFLIVQFNNFA